MSNPNPNVATRFQKGESGNPKGKTSEQKHQELANAIKATKVQGQLVDALAKLVESAGEDGATALINANNLKLLQDTQNRGLGTPKQSHEHSSPDGTMSPKTITRRVVDPKGK